MQPPDFWFRPTGQEGWGGLWSALLAPLGGIYGLVGAFRQDRANPQRADVPVICVGNLLVGGQGKTPTALALGDYLKSRSQKVHFLTRGYGGSLSGPLHVDPDTHSVAQVGDEALLLARCAPTWISADRSAGAERAAEAGAEIIVMDDGFQNTGLHKDISIIVADGAVGFGNGRIMPAGPLREGISVGLNRAQAVVIIGEDRTGLAQIIPYRSKQPVPVIRARLTAVEPEKWRGKKVFAFAGIGRPGKFFDSLKEAGCDVAGIRSFDDHHPYSHQEIASLVSEAKRLGAIPVTTAKDHVRLPSGDAGSVEVLEIALEWDDPGTPGKLLEPVLPTTE